MGLYKDPYDLWVLFFREWRAGFGCVQFHAALSFVVHFLFSFTVDLKGGGQLLFGQKTPRGCFHRRKKNLQSETFSLGLREENSFMVMFHIRPSSIYQYSGMATRRYGQISHFRFHLCLLFKASLSAKLFLWKREAPKSLHWVACGTRYTKNCSVPVNFFKWGVIKTIWGVTHMSR